MKKIALYITLTSVLLMLTGCMNKEVSKDEADETADGKTVVTIEKAGDEEKSDVEIVNAAEDAELAVTSFKNNELVTPVGYQIIRGTTPKNTAKVLINNYSLNKYKAGETEWSYIAATNFGTLKEGMNEYEVKALDKDNEEIDSVAFTINFKPAKALKTNLPKTGAETLPLILTSLAGAWYITRKPRA